MVIIFNLKINEESWRAQETLFPGSTRKRPARMFLTATISAVNLISISEVQRAPAPPKESRPIKDQAIKSKTGWKKMKLAMAGSSAGNGSASTSTQPPTQSSQNHTARGST
uniref:uncharacterized protein LOC105351439 n=1 Tax=Fragaria vesca subsp. vesca TaxID=101020 RepID=UPI0005C973E4|nr:PREDICTED: uncharacterized protein LOC105351439 [Fragaria vesca subsp. vesca]